MYTITFGFLLVIHVCNALVLDFVIEVLHKFSFKFITFTLDVACVTLVDPNHFLF